MDSEELYENNVFPSFQKENKESPVIIDKEFYKNIPLNDIKNLKKLLKALKNIHTFGINYDFINSKELIDKYLNIDYGNNEIDNFINNEVEEDFDNEEEEQEGGDSLENEMFSINKENTSKSIDLDENNEKENLEEKLLINIDFIEYEKKYTNDKKVWWPIKLIYAGKKYYAANHSSYLKNNKVHLLYYYCVIISLIL